MDSLIDDILDDIPLPAPTRGKHTQASFVTRGHHTSTSTSKGHNSSTDIILDDLSPPDPKDIRDVKMGLYDTKTYKMDYDVDLELPDPSGRRKRKGSGASDSTDSILNELSHHLGFTHKCAEDKKKPGEIKGIGNTFWLKLKFNGNLIQTLKIQCSLVTIFHWVNAHVLIVGQRVKVGDGVLRQTLK